jgi:hypothetical protein
MKKLFKIILITPLVLFLIIVCLNFYSVHFDIPTMDEKGAWTSESPDGRFRVTGYSRSSLFDMGVMMPGQGGAWGKGIVILWDNKTGKMLQKTRVEEISSTGDSIKWMIGEPEAIWRKNASILTRQEAPWEGDYVSIQFVDTWPLPSEDGKMPLPYPEIKTYSYPPQ